MVSNRWNRVVYGAWAPVYDVLFSRISRPGRQAAVAELALQPGQAVLLVGVGTGQDLALLPPGVHALGVDLSASMLAHARRSASASAAVVDLQQCDAAKLAVQTGSFDAAILNLVLSVVPDPVAVMQETSRAVRPGGRVVVFDKFVPDRGSPSLGRKALNVVTGIFGTQINRRLADSTAGSPFEVVSNRPSILRRSVPSGPPAPQRRALAAAGLVVVCRCCCR